MELAALIIPSVLAIASLAISISAYRKDTSKLKIDIEYSVSLNEYSTLDIDVRNVGKRPTTILEVGFEVDHELMIELVGQDRVKRTTVPDPALIKIKMKNTPTIIGAGEIRKFRITLDSWPNDFVNADMPLAPYVKDNNGKVTWGIIKPYLRIIIDAKGVIPHNLRKELIEPFNGTLRPVKRGFRHRIVRTMTNKMKAKK